MDDFGVGNIGDAGRGDVAAVAQDGQVIAEGAHLTQAVRDEDDGHALGAFARDDLAEPVDIAAGESRGRLVEQQDLRLAVERAGDFDLLFDGKLDIADFIAQIDAGETERIEMGARPWLPPCGVRQAERIDRRIVQEDIFEDGQVADQGHFLECGLDAVAMRGARRIEPRVGAVDGDLARVGLHKSGEELDDGRLAGAIFAEQRVHGALIDREACAIDGNRRAERLANVMKCDCVGRGVHDAAGRRFV